ncbi:endospore germination permease [Siminovitchia sediminis]|uniref:Endospore germination permease n=1 Tax=Siminovitchia sediminis TaxID=1274353 RepID=A0ABW4KL06_9BACI
MNSFEYGDEKISGKELMIAVPSMVISVGALSLPRDIAVETKSSDGWIALVIAGVFCILIIWMMAKIAASFPHQSFFSYASIIVSKPVAVVLTFIFAILFISLGAFNIRVLGDTSQQYLFNQTPVEVVTLSFLLVVVYAVAGSRAALFRLNMLFFPIIIGISLFVILFNLKWVDWTNLFPVFQTDFQGHLRGIKKSAFAYMGFGIVLFYTAYVDRPKNTPKLAMLGMLIPVVLYVLVYLICLLVFSHAATSHLLFPTIDLAKRIELPGGILERVEAIFFIIFTMAVFTTTAMALDVAILALQSIFKRLKKMQLIFMLSPLLYFIALSPQNIGQIHMFGDLLGNYLVSFTFLTTIVLFIIAKIRGVKPNDQKTT